jgi:hypothetical protein
MILRRRKRTRAEQRERRKKHLAATARMQDQLTAELGVMVERMEEVEAREAAAALEEENSRQGQLDFFNPVPCSTRRSRGECAR